MEDHSDLVALEHRAHGRGGRRNAAGQADQACILYHIFNSNLIDQEDEDP